MLHARLAPAALLIASFALFAETEFTPQGKLERLPLGKGWMELHTDVRIPAKGWSKSWTLSGAKKTVFTEKDGAKIWKAAIGDPGNLFDIEQRVREEDGKLIFHIDATAQDDTDIEGILFWIDLPADHFAGGTMRVRRQLIALPEQPIPDENHVFSSYARRVRFNDPDRRSQLNVGIDRLAPVLVQDERMWGRFFSLLVYVQVGTLPRGEHADAEITLSMDGDVENQPALMSIDSARPLYNIQGIGGTYCFDIQSPVARYTLDHLKVNFARVEMDVEGWEPEAPSEASEKIEWKRYLARDAPNGRLRHGFELMHELTARKIPYAISIWKLPVWMYDVPPLTPDGERNSIDKEKWTQVLNSLGSYLLYAKEKYQAEPDWFSFNEPDGGVRVLFSPREHRDAIKKIGAHFAKLGLKTKMLLGDVTNPRDTDAYVLPTTLDPDAMRYVGALSFHSWLGASPKQYGAWAALAERLKLPLFVAEAGVDPAAWQGETYMSFNNGIREMSLYQDLFRYARPQAVGYWEFTGDYSLMERGKDGRIALTERLGFQKHWTEFIPPGSEALATTNTSRNVQITAFRNKQDYSLHLSNPMWEREAVISGIPGGIKALNQIRTRRGEIFRKLEPLEVVGGRVKLTLPTESLTTLTTMPDGDLPAP